MRVATLTPILGLIASAAVSSVSGFYTAGKDAVIPITKANFEKEIMDNKVTKKEKEEEEWGGLGWIGVDWGGLLCVKLTLNSHSLPPSLEARGYRRVLCAMVKE